MAKLSARGRTELLRVSKEGEGRSEVTDWHRITRAYMSDGTILEKIDVHFKPDKYTPKGKKHSYGWSVRSRGNSQEKEVIEQVKEAYVRQGWKVEK